MTDTDGCKFCIAGLERLPLFERVHVTDHWRITAHRSAMPGWMLLMPHRHTEALSDLNEDEFRELGPLMSQVGRAHVEEFGALKTYVMQFSEGVKHLHFSLAPRMGNQPLDRIGAGSLAYNSIDTPLDEIERQKIAGRLHTWWSRLGA